MIFICIMCQTSFSIDDEINVILLCGRYVEATGNFGVFSRGEIRDVLTSLECPVYFIFGVWLAIRQDKTTVS